MFVARGHREVQSPEHGLHLLGRGPPPALPQLAYCLVQLLRSDRALRYVGCGETADT
jgi:hypothetical protein